MIAIEDLEFTYPRGGFLLRIPELTVPDGTRLAVIGPSGSGKTTFLNLVSGIVAPSRGHVRVDDFEVSAMSDAARRDFRIANIGFVFQDFELLEYLDVYDNILHPYRISRALKLSADVRKRAGDLAAATGLGDKLRRRPQELSHGERQRAAICRALLPDPRLVLADEPTGNLDPAAKDRTMRLLADYAKAGQATLVTVTHDHSLLDDFDRVIDFEAFQPGGRA
jgi:ABC-type lipoprotein export system ATPase subunit